MRAFHFYFINEPHVFYELGNLRSLAQEDVWGFGSLGIILDLGV
jgi:hypothetical protein